MPAKGSGRLSTCHPNLPHASRGMCQNCYCRWMYKNKPLYKKRHDNIVKRWARNHPDLRKNERLKRDHNLTLEEFHMIEKTQNYICAICERPKKLAVDHDHKSLHVRGLLCTRCNGVLGWFEQCHQEIQHYLQDPPFSHI